MIHSARLLPRLVFAVSFFILGAGLPAALTLAGILAWQWLFIGAAAWAVAVAIKGAGDFDAQARLSRWGASLETRAAVSGAWSALCELGLVAMVLLWTSPYPGLSAALSLGFGAGCFEILVLGFVGLSSWSDEDPAAPVWGPIGYSILERVLTLGGHVASRGLLWVGLMGGLRLLWLAPALSLFALVDGTVAYGTGRSWNWQEPLTQRRFYLFIAVVGAVEALLFWLALRAL